MPSRFTQYGGVAGAEGALREMVAERLMAEAAQAKAQQQDFENQLKMRAMGQTDQRIGLDADQMTLAREQFELSKQPKAQGPMSVGANQRLVDPATGRIIVPEVAEQPKPAGPMNLGPGSVAVDPTTGRIIFRNPAVAAAKDPEADLRMFEEKERIKAKYGGSRPSLGAERTALAYFNRAKQASEDITPLEENVAKAGTLSQYQLQYAPNIAQSAEQQAYRQAQRAFTEARLRKESGAAIPTAEYENDAKTYFAQPGDDINTMKQKREARQRVLEGLQFASGKAYEEFFGEPNKPRGAAPAGGVVPMVAPDGRLLNVPADKVAELEAKGAKRR